GADVEELRAREAEDEDRRVAHPGGQVLDEVEERVLGPVDVLEDEHERLYLGELLRPGARRPRELLPAALALDGGEDPGGKPEQVGDGLDLARRPQLLERLVDGIV